MLVPMLVEALVRWQHAAGLFWPYVCAAPFLGTGEGAVLARDLTERCTRQASNGLDGYVNASAGSRAGRRSRRTVLAERLLAAAAPSEGPSRPRPCASGRGPGGEGISRPTGTVTVVLVDLPAEPILALAPLLVERGWYVVPVVQRWIASPAVLPCRRLLERLVLGGWQARRPTTPHGAILVADGERAGPPGYPTVARGRAFDNRYEYQVCRFPSLDFLVSQQVARVVWISAWAGGQVAPDLAPYREDLPRAGIAVEVVSW